MINKTLPHGWLPVTEAIKRVVWRQCPGAGPKERDKAEEAWRELCKRAFEGHVRAIVLTADGKTFNSDPAQFIALQERYLFHAGTQGYWPENERRYVELEIAADREFLNNHGRSVRGELLFSESDIETVFGVAVPPEKPSFDEVRAPGKKPHSEPRRKNRQAFDRARGVIEALYPNGVPDQATEPNAILCKKVAEKLRESRLPGVSDSTVLRAAGRVCIAKA
jgi:hypothetical protein